MKAHTVSPLDLVRLTPLVAKTDGRSEVTIGLIDGPVFLAHPDLVGHNIQEVPGNLRVTCTRADSSACLHGTFVAGILCGRRGSAAPAICPGCTLLVRPIYPETGPAVSEMPSSTPDELAEAIVDCVDGGARILNLSLVLTGYSAAGSRNLAQALDYAMSRGVLAVADLSKTMDAANVRREFKAACKAANIGPYWTPRELRHSFVSLMSSSGCQSRRSLGSRATRTPGPPRLSTGASCGRC